MEDRSNTKLQWSSRFTYILAATGAAVGLGNIWKFPYIMGENGGGAFVLVYLLCILFIGLPVMISEVLIGKFGRKAPNFSVNLLAKASGNDNKAWSVVGWIGVIAGYLILSFYVVIAGWALAYTFLGFQDVFSGKSTAEIGSLFSNLTSSAEDLLFWTSIIVFITTFIVAKGVKSGLEYAIKWMMPILLILLMIITVYSIVIGDFSQALFFMFYPDFSELTWHSVLIALGHSFFTLSLASGVMMMYGAYFPNNASVVKTSLWIAFMDTFVAILAGIAIYPIVFGSGIEPSAGPGLLFQSLPIAFGQMPLGWLFGGLFFFMVVISAISSAIALIESSVAWLENKFELNRMLSATIAGGGIWLLSLLTIFSLTGASWTQLTFFGNESISIFDFLDYLTANILLPIGGLLIALFIGYKVKQSLIFDELSTYRSVFNLWFFAIKYIVPIAVLLVFLQLIDVI